MSNDYIPAPDVDAAAWGVNFAALITAVPATYGLTAGDALIIQGASDDFDAALTLAIDPGTRTPVTVADKDAKRVTAEGIWRPYAQTVRNDPAVLDMDKVALGITVPDTSRTPIPAPTTAPALELRSIAPGVLKIAYSDTGAPSGKAKPYGSIGVEIWVKVDAASDSDPANASFRQVATKAPFDLTFTAPQAGSVASIFGRFVTRSGPAGIAQRGPWSAMLASYIA